MNKQQPTSAKAAFMHQGQARQPAPKPTSACYALARILGVAEKGAKRKEARHGTFSTQVSLWDG